MRVLIVDDHPTNLRLLRAQLEAEGHAVLQAADGVEALARLESRPVDAVVSDILMPRMDGYRLCSALRKSERWRALPFIFHTATYVSPAEERLALDLGADKFIKKPAAPVELIAALAEVTRPGPQRTSQPKLTVPESELLNEYSERLVARLEERNVELARGTEELIAAQGRLRHLLAASPMVVYSLRVADKTVAASSFSESVERMTGFTIGETLESNWWGDHLHPADRERMRARMLSRVLDEQGFDEYRLRHRNGSQIWVRDDWRLARDAGGQPVEIIGSWADITGRKQGVHQFAVAGAPAGAAPWEQFQQAQKLEALGLIAGGVVHDFNILLTAVQGHIVLLQTAKNLDPGVAENLRQITAASERAARLASQLLAFSRGTPMESRRLDLNEVVAGVSKMLKRIIGEDVALRIEAAPSLPALQGDPGLLEQVLLNLAVNARDAMGQRGMFTLGTTLAVISEAEALLHPQGGSGEFVRLRAADTGCGMTPETKARIFEPFFTTKPPGRGAGLGLATVHGIVRQHRGWVEVESQPGEGTTFDLYFPVPGPITTAAAPA